MSRYTTGAILLLLFAARLFAESEGERLFKSNDPTSAIPILERELSSGIASAAAYNYLGLSYYQTGQYDKSVATFERGLRVSGTDKKVLAYNAGNSAFAAGNYAKADSCYSLALSASPDFAKALVEGCTAAVNDAFGVSHRAHASVVGVGKLLPMVSGLLLKKEIDFLDGVIENPKRPFAAIIGGAKISDKIQVIANLMEKADVIMIGGGMANTFVAAEGYDMGRSLQDKDRFELARNLMKKAKEMGSDIILPVDFMAGDAFSEKANTKVLEAKDFSDPWMALDIGPKTIRLYVETLRRMKSVVWNGPMGVFEMKPFATGTFAIAEAIANLDATTVIGGGESASVVDQMGIEDKFSHVSTGGGASLEMLEGMVLPGVAVLADKE